MARPFWFAYAPPGYSLMQRLRKAQLEAGEGEGGEPPFPPPEPEMGPFEAALEQPEGYPRQAFTPAGIQAFRAGGPPQVGRPFEQRPLQPPDIGQTRYGPAFEGQLPTGAVRIPPEKEKAKKPFEVPEWWPDLNKLVSQFGSAAAEGFGRVVSIYAPWMLPALEAAGKAAEKAGEAVEPYWEIPEVQAATMYPVFGTTRGFSEALRLAATSARAVTPGAVARGIEAYKAIPGREAGAIKLFPGMRIRKFPTPGMQKQFDEIVATAREAGFDVTPVEGIKPGEFWLSLDVPSVVKQSGLPPVEILKWAVKVSKDQSQRDALIQRIKDAGGEFLPFKTLGDLANFLKVGDTKYLASPLKLGKITGKLVAPTPEIPKGRFFTPSRPSRPRPLQEAQLTELEQTAQAARLYRGLEAELKPFVVKREKLYEYAQTPDYNMATYRAKLKEIDEAEKIAAAPYQAKLKVIPEAMKKKAQAHPEYADIEIAPLRPLEEGGAPTRAEITAAPAVPQAAPTAKQPWEMTKGDWDLEKVLPTQKYEATSAIRKSNTAKRIRLHAQHKQAVEQALAEGKPVPAEVLKDYPDLAAMAKPAIPEAAPAVPKPAEAVVPGAEAVPTVVETEAAFIARNMKFAEEEAKALGFPLNKAWQRKEYARQYRLAHPTEAVAPGAESTFRRDLGEMYDAGKEIADELKATNYRLHRNPDGTITIYHGTSPEAANLIKQSGRFEGFSFFSHAQSRAAFGSEGAKQYGKEVLTIKVDPRDVSFHGGTGEIEAEFGLVRGKDGIWRAPHRVPPGAESAAAKVAFEAAPTPEVGGVPAGQARAPQALPEAPPAAPIAEAAPPTPPVTPPPAAVPPVRPAAVGGPPPGAANPLTLPSPGRQPIKVPEVRPAEDILVGIRQTYPRRLRARTPQATTLKEAKHLQMNAQEVGRNSQAFLLARLTETGSPVELFGIQASKVTKVGNPNNLSTAWGDVYENYTKYKLTGEQRQLIENFHGIEDGLKAEAARHGVDIAELAPLDAMWHYSARKVTGKGKPRAEGVIRVSGKSLGAKESFQRQRVFEFMQDGLDRGFTYADPSETMQSIIGGYYRLIGDRLALERVKPLGQVIKPGERLPYGEFRTRQPGLFGYEFPTEIARDIDNLFTPEVVNRWVNLSAKAVSPFIPLKAALDASWFAIQGALPIAHSIFAGKPQVAARVIAGATKALINPKTMDVFRRNHAPTYLEALPHNLITGTTEFFEALGPLGKAIGKAPVVGKGLARGIKETYGRASAMFDAASEQYRIIGWETYKEAWVKGGGTVDQLGDFLNIMSGVMSSKLAGVSATRQALERIPAFAPRFYRANFMVLGHLFDGTKTAREVQKGLAGLFALAYLQHLTTSLAADQPLKLDPRPKALGGNGGEWLTNEVEGQNVGLGTFQLGLARLMATVGAVAVDEPTRLVRWDRRSNPVLSWLYGKGTPPIHFINEMAHGVDFMGNELRGAKDYLTQVFSLGLPIAAESILFDEPQPGPVATAVALLGGRQFPVNPKDAMARSMFGGKDFRDLSPAELRDLRQTPGWSMFVEEAPMPKDIREREQERLDQIKTLKLNSSYLGTWTGRGWSNAQKPDLVNPGQTLPYSAKQWREDLRDMQVQAATVWATRERLMGPMKERKPRDDKEKALWDYYNISDNYKAKDKDGRVIKNSKILDMEGFIKEQDEYLAGLTPELEKHVLESLGVNEDDLAQEFRRDKRVIKQDYWEPLRDWDERWAMQEELLRDAIILKNQGKIRQAESLMVRHNLRQYAANGRRFKSRLRLRSPEVDELLVKWGYSTAFMHPGNKARQRQASATPIAPERELAGAGAR